MKKIISIVVMACMITGCAGLKPDEMVKTGIQDNAVSTGTDIPEEEQNQEEGVLQQEEKEKQSGNQQSFISRHWGKGVVCIIGVVVLASIIIYISITTTKNPNGGKKGEVIKKTYDITATLDEKVRSKEGEAKRICDEIDNLDEIKAGRREVLINFNLENDSDPPIECLFKINCGGLIVLLVSAKLEEPKIFCGLREIGFSSARNVSLGRIETSEPIDKLKVRCSKKFVEELIRITAREVPIP